MTKPDYYTPDSTTDVHTPQNATTSAFCILDTSKSIHHLKSLYYNWNQKALVMAMP